MGVHGGKAPWPAASTDAWLAAVGPSKFCAYDNVCSDVHRPQVKNLSRTSFFDFLSGVEYALNVHILFLSEIEIVQLIYKAAAGVDRFVAYRACLRLGYDFRGFLLDLAIPTFNLHCIDDFNSGGSALFR